MYKLLIKIELQFLHTHVLLLARALDFFGSLLHQVLPFPKMA